jgi:sirohydrochlorin ferrochelatase
MAARGVQGSGFDSKGNRTTSSLTQPVAYDEKEFSDLPGIDDVLRNLSFVGFRPDVLRDEVKKTPNAKPKEIEFLLASYVQIGNRPENALDRRRAKPDGRVSKLVTKYGHSLARLAIAYMPVLHVIRRRAKTIGVLQNQFPDSKVDEVLQDVAFSGWKGAEILPFLLRFDEALKPTGTPAQHGEEAVRRWTDVAKRGFENDSSVKNIMANVTDEKLVSQWFASQFSS